MTKYIYHDTVYLERDLLSSCRRKKKCIRIVFCKDLYGDVHFTVVFRKLTKNNEKLKNNIKFASDLEKETKHHEHIQIIQNIFSVYRLFKVRKK